MSDETKTVATAKDALFFQTILCSMKNKPDVDWSVVAIKAGYKDARTASTRYGQIMKKLTGVSAGKAMSGSTNTTSPVKKTNGAPKKVIGSGMNGNAMKVTKPRATSKTKKVVQQEDDERYERFMDGFTKDEQEFKVEEREVVGEPREVLEDVEEQFEG